MLVLRSQRTETSCRQGPGVAFGQEPVREELHPAVPDEGELGSDPDPVKPAEEPSTPTLSAAARDPGAGNPVKPRETPVVLSC